MSTLKYWLWLTTRRGMGTLLGRRLLDRFGTPEAVYFADEGEYSAVEALSDRARQSLLDKTLEGAEQILEACDRLGYRLMSWQDADYPNLLRQISDPPLVLYVRGKLPPVDEQLVLSIVGARKSSPYGEKVAGTLAVDLARAGTVLCTGIAPGIDTVAIRGALRAGGRVVSVLAGGLDLYQGGSERGLYDDIAAVGALVSEYPPGTPHMGDHYRPRNRIISGLSRGVIVVEGGESSGTLITAHAALEQGREVFAVPGPVDAPESAAPNRLIHDGEALLVRNAEDVLNEFSIRIPLRREQKPLKAEETRQRLEGVLEQTRPAEPPKPSVRPEQPMALPRLTGGENEALTDDQRDLLTALEQQTLHPDELVEQTGLPARRVLSALTLLQMKGYIQEETGKRFTARFRVK